MSTAPAQPATRPNDARRSARSPWVLTVAGADALRGFVIAVVVSAAIVLVSGLFTGLRAAMHGALLSVATAALLPFAIMAAGVALAMFLFVLSSLAALFGGDGGVDASDAGLVEAGARLVPGYYRFLFARFVARRRHPVFWGVPVGALLGGLAIWGWISVAVLPRETSTAELLVQAQQRIDRHYAAHGHYPRPDVAGHLPWSSFETGDDDDRDDAAGAASAAARHGVLTDGFGRPLEYRVAGRWRVASYTIRSLGYDGRPGGGDDLCRSGATRLGRFASRINVGRGETGGVSFRIRLGAVREMRCHEGE